MKKNLYSREKPMKYKSGTNSHIHEKKWFKEYIQSDLVIYTCEKKNALENHKDL